MKRGAEPGSESRSFARCGRLVLSRDRAAEAGREHHPPGARGTIPLLREAADRAAHAPSRRRCTTVQIAQRYGVNPGFLEQMVDHLQRSNGARRFGLVCLGDSGHRGAAERLGLACRAAVSSGRAGYARSACRSVRRRCSSRRCKEGKTTTDPGAQGALRLSEGEVRSIPRSGQRPPLLCGRRSASSSRKLDEELKALEAATPEFPRAMGVRESDKIDDLAIHIRGSHWTLGEKVPRRFLSVIAGDDQPAIGSDRERPAATGPMDDAEGPPAHQPRDGQPHLALAFRPRHRPERRQLRPARREAVESAAARLARAAVRRTAAGRSRRCTG